MNANEERVDLVGTEYVVGIAGAALMAALTGVMAYVAFTPPFSPVPYTLQILGVFLVAIFLGARWGAVSMILYLIAGAVGAPIFAQGAAGIGALLGESAGYLFSFPIAVFVMGYLLYGHTRMGDPASVGVVRLVGALVAGATIIYVMGVIGLMVILQLSLWEAVFAGAVVFFPGEIGKIVAAVGIAQSGHVVDWPPRSIQGEA